MNYMAVFKPIIQGKIDMTYPHAGERVNIISIDRYNFTEPDDPMCTIQFKNGELGWCNMRDLELIK